MGGGLLVSLPLATTSCSSSEQLPTKLLIDKSLNPINANLDNEITPTIDISRLIKTDTGESVSGVTFICEGLPNGLSINESTGVILGTPTRIQESTSHEIKFSCTLKEIPLEGSTEINIQINGPQSIVCSQIEDKSIVVNESFSLGVANVKMVFDGGVEKSISSDDVTYELLDSDGQSAASTLPQGLSFNTTQRKISGTVTSLNYYVPKTYKIKIIGSQRIGSLVGYSNTFTLSMENNPMPDTVYDIDENNVLLGFKEGVDLFQYDGICNTMQIPVRVTSVDHSAFEKDLVSLIPSFITNLIFANGSNCSTIGQLSFAYNSSLTSIDLSQATKLTFIGSTPGGGTFSCCTKLISVKFPSSLNKINQYCFAQSSNLSSITWDAWKGNTEFGVDPFDRLPTTGIVIVTNPIDDAHNSAALLAYLKTKGLPTGWTIG